MRFFFFILLTVSACAQSVGDFSIPYKANSTGPQTLKSWAKANSTLWGTDGSGNPQSITIGSGLSLASGVLTSSGGGGVGTGTVTSVALTMPNIFSVTGSPITASGTLAASLATQSANAVFAGPTTGAAAAPTFRALVAADIPDLSGVYQPLASALTAFGELANASGVLTNNGSGALSYTATSFGGDSSSYNGQLVKFANSNGSILASTEIKIYQYPSGTNYLNLSPSQIRWFRGASDYCAIIPSEAGSACTFYFPTNPGTHTLALEDGNITGTAGGLSSTLAVTSGGTGQTSYTDGQLLIGNTTGNTLSKATLTAGSGISITNGHGTITIASTSSGGTVTSVALTLPNIFSVSGSPITESGTLAASLATQTANRVWAGPTTGSAAAPTFRALVSADIPDLSGTYQPLNAKLTTLAAGLGGALGPQLVTWDGTTYAKVNGALASGYGGTGISIYETGDILYATGGSLARLVGNTSTTKKYLSQTGDGTASAAPVWEALGTLATQNGTFSGTSSGTNTGDQTITLTGDVTGSGTSSFAATLANTSVVAGTYGNATQGVAITVDAKGRLTTVTTNTITPAIGSITGLGSGIATALAINTGSAGAPVLFNGAGGAPSSINLANGTALPVSGITSSTSTALGLGSIELGHASDTTIARSGVGNITVEGQTIYRAGGSFTGMPVEIVVACSDETTALTTGTAKVTFRMPHAMTVSSVRLQVNTAPTGSVIIVDVKEAGTTIFSTKPQIATSAFTSVGGAVPGTLSDTSLADDAEITINLDQIGSTIAGKSLKVTLIGTRQ